MESIDWDLFSSYAGLLCLATFSIYCGAHDSLPTRPRARAAPKQSLLQDEEEEEEEIPDRMSSSDAWLFPILGSAVLFGMYMVLTYVGAEWVNWMLGWYFSIAGVGSVWKSTVSLARFAIGWEKWRTFDRHRLLLLRGPLEVLSLSFRTPTLMLLPVGMLPSILYRTLGTGGRRSGLLTDVLALSFSHNALSILKLDSFQTGCILLSGLFVYDIYWVFGTKVMVQVATSLDVPIKLLWPKSVSFGTRRGFTMLGLGDVVIPGMFVALALRYDVSRAENMQGKTRWYFLVTLTGYVVGLATTMAVMHWTGSAQPALLYLSPACILALVGTAVVRGEMEDVWRWSDAAEKNTEKGKGEPAIGNGADGGHVAKDRRA